MYCELDDVTCRQINCTYSFDDT